MEGESKAMNGERTAEEEVLNDSTTKFCRHHQQQEEGLYRIICSLLWSVFCPDHTSSLCGTSFFYRAKVSLKDDFPRLRDASKNAGLEVLQWTRRGSPFRALVVISVGTFTLLTLTGLLVFMLFFVAATFNAIVISLLMSLAAAGGFLAIFFACVAAIYIGALSVAIFVISTATISAVIAPLVAVGWIGFFWTMWFAAKKSTGLAKHSLDLTASALSAYSLGRSARPHGHHHND